MLHALAAPAAGFALAFWAYYAFLRQVAGPLGPDEVYFTHILWLVGQGKRLYVDFNTNHLPAYFLLLRPLVTAFSATPQDLGFVWALRGMSALVLLAYVGMACVLHRRLTPHAGRASLLASCALVLVFVVLGRMAEIRSDTVGLLLANAAWVCMLCGPVRRRMLAAAAVLAGLALLFSVRAPAMVGPIGLCLLYLARRSRDRAALRALLAVAAGFVAAALLLFAAAGDGLALVVRSAYLEPARLLAGGVPHAVRFFYFDRFPLVFAMAVALVAGWRMTGKDHERGVILAVAAAAQVLMLLVDPAPYQYVYGWAAVPVVFGVVWLSRAAAVYVPFLVALAGIALAIVYAVLKGQPAPTGHYLRLTFDPVMPRAEVEHLATPDLVALAINDARQQNLATQLRLRSELCGRLHGTVLSTFGAHPICVADALHDWTGITWSAALQGKAVPPGGPTIDDFEAAFLRARPDAYIWGVRLDRPRELQPRIRKMLECCYDLHEGFALSKDLRSATVSTE